MNARLAILGAGSWGTALAVLWHELGVVLWDHRSERAARLARDRVNAAYLPDVAIPESVTITADLDAAVAAAHVLVLAVPSHALRELARTLRSLPGVESDRVLVNTAKGLEEDTRQRLSEVLAQELPGARDRIVSLVGPSHAEEVARGMPTTVVVTGPRLVLLEEMQQLFTTETFRVYTNPDVVGVELAVAVKNIIAIAAGICDGLGFGDNSKGALLTRGLAEMTRLGVALGARSQTFAGLAGLGDLVTTAMSRHSRNRGLGEAIGRGLALEAALGAQTQVCEGVRTTRAVRELAEQHGIEMPITEQVHQILFAGKPPREAIRELMLRAPKPETWSASGGDA